MLPGVFNFLSQTIFDTPSPPIDTGGLPKISLEELEHTPKNTPTPPTRGKRISERIRTHTRRDGHITTRHIYRHFRRVCHGCVCVQVGKKTPDRYTNTLESLCVISAWLAAIKRWIFGRAFALSTSHTTRGDTPSNPVILDQSSSSWRDLAREPRTNVVIGRSRRVVISLIDCGCL